MNEPHSQDRASPPERPAQAEPPSARRGEQHPVWQDHDGVGWDVTRLDLTLGPPVGVWGYHRVGCGWRGTAWGASSEDWPSLLPAISNRGKWDTGTLKYCFTGERVPGSPSLSPMSLHGHRKWPGGGGAHASPSVSLCPTPIFNALMTEAPWENERNPEGAAALRVAPCTVGPRPRGQLPAGGMLSEQIPGSNKGRCWVTLPAAALQSPGQAPLPSQGPSPVSGPFHSPYCCHLIWPAVQSA